jgi:repressor LexA
MTTMPTPKQKRMLDFIRSFTGANGYAPSQREIADHFGYSSLGTVQNFLVRLERLGLLKREWNAKRALAPLEPKAVGTELPLVGRVAAGLPIESVETPETLEVPPTMLGRGENFVLRVSGDSMIGEGILDGDYLVVKKASQAFNGQTVVALVDGEATVKNYYRRSDAIELRAANPAYEDILVGPDKQFSLEGIVVGVIRHC